MKIRTFYKLTNGVYKVSINTEDWSELDIQLMAKYGEPEIDTGGDFSGSVEYSLDNDLQRVKSQAPFAISFDTRDYADADQRAELWADTITERITTAVGLLRANDDGFSREEVLEV